MTSARRRGKSFASAPAALLRVLLLSAACAVVWPAPWNAARDARWAGAMRAQASTTERVVTNPRTGLAIDGYDPVAYFIDAAAEVGRPAFELRHREAIWRFRNSGNRAAFVDNPGDYEPRFGGYDPVAISRGSPTPGNPEIWLIIGQKLYLFYGTQTQEEFRSDPRRIAVQAEARWPDVAKVLSQ
jgi:hypothetical protein